MNAGERWSGARLLLVLFVVALLVRLVIAVIILPDGGHRSDLQILTDWARELAANGPRAFYRPDSGYFADYPPAYLYVLWFTGVAGQAWSATFGGADITPLMLKLPFILADLGVGAVLFLMTRHLFGRRAGVAAAAIFLFNPAVILLSTVWAQNDSIATLAVVSSLYFLVTGRTAAAAALAVLAMLVKFQYGFAIPIVAIVGLRRHLIEGGTREWHRVGLSLVAGISTLVVVCWPFGLVVFNPADPAHSLLARFIGASKAFPGVTQNAFNLWMNPFFDVIRVGSSGLTEGHVVDDAVAAVTIGGLALTWQWLGNVLFIAAVLVALAVLLRRTDGPTVLFVALFIAVAFFALPTRVHERYLYPALALGLPLLAAGNAWRRLHVALSAVLFLDVYWVYTLPIGNAGPGRGFLGETIYSAPGIYLLSAVTVGSMAWLVWRAIRPASLAWSATPAHEPVSASPATGSGAAGPPGPLDGALERGASIIRGLRPPSGIRMVTGLAIISFLSAIVVARVNGPGGPWLWNLDMPKIDFPLASFFHDALGEGRLPLWNDYLGLGYPLYAEGQIGAFYPPNWLLFRFPPLVALDMSRVLHLTIAGAGSGLLVLRVAGSRSGAFVAALVAVLGGAIAAKLEWHNLIAAYAYMPWVLVPLVRRPGPTRAGLVAAGLLFGVQAWTGHPNTWLLTGLAAAVVMLAIAPRPRTLGRIVGFGVLGGLVGGIALLPTAILTTLSVRSQSLSPNDLFTSSATPFDILLFGFQNAFVRNSDGAWNLTTNWYPDGSFALLEAAAYVGLPVLALAAVGVRASRARPFVVLALVSLAIPIIAAFRPDPWMEIPVLNGLRSPVRSYIVVCLALAVLAGIGVGRLGRSPGAIRRASVAVALPIGAYALIAALAVAVPTMFDRLLLDASSFLGAAQVEARRQAAIEALTVPWPLLLELAVGLVALVVVVRASRLPSARTALSLAVVIVAAIPLLILGPTPNGARQFHDFSFAGSDYVQALIASEPRRMFALDPPGWYAGMPDQLATARIHDIRMFTSLDLLAADRLVKRLAEEDYDGNVRRAIGVDVVVAFTRPCPGRLVTVVEQEGATICRDDGALRPPYWLPLDVGVDLGDGSAGSLIRPREVELDAARVAAAAIPQVTSRRDVGELVVEVNAPAAGWLWVDRSWWPAWRTTVDSVAVDADLAMGGQLVPVPAGSSVVRQVLVPWDALAGLAVGVLAALAALGWVWRGRRQGVSPSVRRRPSPRESCRRRP